MRPQKQTYIYTPQGRATRYLVEESRAIGLSGLYTDGFTRCNIVACVSNKRLSLMHADIRTQPDEIEKEFKWVGDEAELIIFFRAPGKPIVEGFMKKGLKFSLLKQVDDSVDGVLLTLDTCQYNFVTAHVYTTTKSLQPAESELVHHPQEYEFLRAHKIEQTIVGVSKEFLYKTNPIFDGRYWEKICQEECEVHAPNQETKIFLQKLEKCQDFFSYHSELNLLAKKILQEEHYEGADLLTLFGDMLEIAFYIDLLFNDRLSHLDNLKKNIAAMLKSNIRLVFQTDHYQCKPEDFRFSEKIKQLCEKSDPENELSRYQSYYSRQSLNPYQDQTIKKDLPKLLHFYQRRIEVQRTLQTNIQENRKVLKKKISTICELYKEGNFLAARNLFPGALALASQLYTKADHELASIHYSMGRTLYKLNTPSKFTEYFFKTALSMVKTFDPSNTAFIQKVESAIRDHDMQKIESPSRPSFS